MASFQTQMNVVRLIVAVVIFSVFMPLFGVLIPAGLIPLIPLILFILPLKWGGWRIVDQEGDDLDEELRDLTK